MQRNQRTSVAGLIACLLASVPTFGAGSDTQTRGIIISRTGESLIVKTQSGNVNVVLDDGTTTKDDKGLFGLDKQQISNIVLIPGLKVRVDGVADGQSRIVAKTITVDGDDLETAQMIQSGLHPTAQQVIANQQKIAGNTQNITANKNSIENNRKGIAENRQDVGTNRESVAANKQRIETNQQSIAAHQQQIEANMKDIQENTDRFTALSEYDVKSEVTVRFKIGSSKIQATDFEQLNQLAQTAKGLTGYIIEVTGYADATGSAKMNTKLSEDRAKEVVTHLMQQCGVPIRHIVAPGAMGEYGAAAPNETKDGRAQNRRVEVKILVNKGIAGS